MTSTKVTSPARAREVPLPPRNRDLQATGPCLYPGCETWCEEFQPACLPHWRNAPEALVSAIRDGWRAKDQRRWLLAIEALRLYWHAVAP